MHSPTGTSRQPQGRTLTICWTTGGNEAHVTGENDGKAEFWTKASQSHKLWETVTRPMPRASLGTVLTDPKIRGVRSMFLCWHIHRKILTTWSQPAEPLSWGPIELNTHTSTPEATPGVFHPYTGIDIHRQEVSISYQRQTVSWELANSLDKRPRPQGRPGKQRSHHTHCPWTQSCHLNVKKS